MNTPKRSQKIAVVEELVSAEEDEEALFEL